MSISTIDPKQSIFTYDKREIIGYADGTHITIAYNADFFTPLVGNTGEQARVASHNHSATITLTLLQSSESNDFLSDNLNTDKSTKQNIVTCSFKDFLGNTQLDGSGAYIIKPADVVYSNNVEARVWSIYVADLSGKIGGNTL
jgi:hypothetical protein